MKSSSLMTTRAALLLVLPAVALGLNPPASSQTAARDYSFTISTTQAWTDTGIDLQAGDTIEVTATPAHAVAGPSGNVCDPRGASGSDQANSSLPVAAAPAGSLIARLQEQGTALAVGGNGRLKADAPGHLFFGVNGGANAQSAPDCTGNFAVKVHIAGAAPAAAAGNGLAASPLVSTPATPASTAAAPTPASTAASPATSTRPLRRPLRHQRQRRPRTSSPSWPRQHRYFSRDNSVPVQPLQVLRLRRSPMRQFRRVPRVRQLRHR